MEEVHYREEESVLDGGSEFWEDLANRGPSSSRGGAEDQHTLLREMQVEWLGVSEDPKNMVSPHSSQKQLGYPISWQGIELRGFLPKSARLNANLARI